MRIYPKRRIGIAECEIDGCERLMFARGWCANHYGRWRRWGDPHGGRAETLEERFWSKVQKRGEGECWLWIAHCNRDGYGMFRYQDDPNMERAHRAAWRLMVGPIPEGLEVLHHCDTPPCVNPAHLFLGTQQDNIRDMLAKGRHVKRGQKTRA